jgi:hypothetical protein
MSGSGPGRDKKLMLRLLVTDGAAAKPTLWSISAQPAVSAIAIWIGPEMLAPGRRYRAVTCNRVRTCWSETASMPITGSRSSRGND